MNKRTRLVVSLLFAVVILLAAAITRFYVSVPKSDGGGGSGEGIDKIISSDGSGYSIFTDADGMYGISESNRIIAAPEWEKLEFIGGYRCIAAKKLNGRLSYGFIDYEGNVAVPLIYSSIVPEKLGSISLFSAVTETGTVIYSDELLPVFRCPWKEYNISDGDLILTDERGNFTYTSAQKELLFKSASVNGKIDGHPYDLNIYSRVLLSKLDPMMIEKMTEAAGKYIEYAFDRDELHMKGVTSGGIRDFKVLFPDSPEITSLELHSVPDVHIYSVRSDDGTPHYEVSITVKAEISYVDEYGNISVFFPDLKAAVKFRGGSEGSLKAMSGSFELSKPEYPPAEDTEDVYSGNVS